MKIIANKLWRVGNNELGYIQQAIEGGLTSEFTKKFETYFANKLGIKYAIAVNSGTSALHAAMGALDIGPGDEVIVPPLTFIATIFAPLYMGAVPVFADIDPYTFNISPESIRQKINKKTKAIITVSLYGLSPEMDEIINIALQNNLKVVEDNAQCVLGKYKDRIVGTLGDISIISLQRSKHLTTGDGGVAFTDNEILAKKMRKFSDLGYKNLTALPISNEQFKDTLQRPDYIRHDTIGFNYRMPEICAAMGMAQLDAMEKLLEKRVTISKHYSEAIKGCEWLVPQKIPDGIQHTYWTYAAKLDSKVNNVSWEKFRKVFRQKGGDRFYGAWRLAYLEPALEGKVFPEHGIKYEKGLCPVAETVQPQLIQFKTNFESIDYAKKQADILADTIAELT